MLPFLLDTAKLERLIEDGQKTGIDKPAVQLVSKVVLGKWQRSFDHEHQSMTWLWYDWDTHNRFLNSLLWCDVCSKYQINLTSCTTITPHGLTFVMITSAITIRIADNMIYAYT